jgi:hypothetical protein
VVTGDGALGYPPCARYDRVIVTAACNQIQPCREFFRLEDCPLITRRGYAVP